MFETEAGAAVSGNHGGNYSMGPKEKGDKINPVLTFHLLSAGLAMATAWWAETRFLDNAMPSSPGRAHPLRLSVASSVMAFVLWLAVFQPLASFGQTLEVDIEGLPVSSLFAVQLILLLAVGIWWAAHWLGNDGVPRPASNESPEEPPVELPAIGSRAWIRPRLACLRLWSERPLYELALGLMAGAFAWGGVLLTVLAVAAVAMALGGEGLVSEPPSEIIVWMVELGVGTRLLISLSAGVTEEIFFRGYLQPRLGILPTTLCFIAAHASYGRPFMLVGVGLLSLLYGLLSRWRGSIWAAISAHVLFDAVQLLVVIPAALKATEMA